MSSKKKTVAIIGLGRFGGSICKELYRLGHEVLAIDNNQSKVYEFQSYSTHAISLDSTNESALKASGIRNMEYVIIAIGEDIQASILTTLVLKEMGISKLWVKAQNSYHHKVLEKIGADRVIHPEDDMGKKVAKNMVSEKIIDYIDLSDDHSIVELVATLKVHQKTIIELDIRAKYQVTILAIRRGKELIISPRPEDVIIQGDLLVVIGGKQDIKRFENDGL